MIRKLLSGVALALLTLSMPPAAMAEDSLTDVLISVYNKNPRLLAERARLREVDESYVQARAQGRLTATASGSLAGAATRTPRTEGSFFQPASGGWEEGVPLSGQVQVIQPLYQGGRVRALKRQAAAGVLAARENLRNNENNIFLAAANAFVDVRQAESAARIRRNNVRVLTRQLEAAEARFEVGEGTRTDIAQSQSRLALAESGLAQADAQLISARAAFRRIVGRAPVDLSRPPKFIKPNSLQEAIALAREHNPQLLATQYNEDAGRAAIDVAKAFGKPTLSLNGTFASSRDQLLGFAESDQAALTAQLTVPIFAGGLNKSRVRQAKHAKTRLAFETRDTELAVDQTVTQIWAQLEAAEATLVASRKQVEAARVAFEGVELELTVGTRTQLDVLNAEQEVLNAQLSLIEAERNLSSASFQLLSTIGVFDAIGLQLNVDEYNPVQNFEAVKYRGYDRFVDKYVAEIVQDAAEDVPELARGLGASVVGAGELLGVPEVLEVIDEYVIDDGLETLEILGEGAKYHSDRMTLQQQEFHPLKDTPLPKIETEPVQPMSQPQISSEELVDGPASIKKPTYFPPSEVWPEDYPEDFATSGPPE